MPSRNAIELMCPSPTARSDMTKRTAPRDHPALVGVRARSTGSSAPPRHRCIRGRRTRRSAACGCRETSPVVEVERVLDLARSARRTSARSASGARRNRAGRGRIRPAPRARSVASTSSTSLQRAVAGRVAWPASRGGTAAGRRARDRREAAFKYMQRDCSADCALYAHCIVSQPNRARMRPGER